jgi:hypothetical protein
MSEWLDTETKAMLQQSPPEKLAPPDTGMFTLVLLEKGNDRDWITRALRRIPGMRVERATVLAERSCPVVVAAGLSLADAMLGQFELICCDSVSVFLKDEIVAFGDRQYLDALYQQVRNSPEFQPIAVTVGSLTGATSIAQFLYQFLGAPDASAAILAGHLRYDRMMRKKARIMEHWARKIGVEVLVANGNDA